MTKDADLVREALLRFEDAHVADLPNRERAEGDMRFLTGDEQWPETVRQTREAAGKPCLTINGLPQFVRQVTGQIRQINPAIRIVAADNDATEDAADIYEGLVRQIEYKCEASSVYEGAAERAAAGSIGHFRVRTDYEPGATFNQEILIEPIYNPFSVFFDPLAKHPTRKDSRYCFVLDEMDIEAFKADYPGKATEDVSGENRPDGVERWYTPDTVTVAEYFYVEHDDVKIGLLRDGSVIENPEAIHDVIKTRTVRQPRVMWAKITGADVLEGPVEMPCREIPILAVTGEEWHLGEEMYRSSVIRFAKDPQQLYNYSRSAHAEMIALQPKAPYMITPKQVAGLESIWATANTSNRAYLPYNPDEKAPPPARQAPPMPSTGLLQEIGLAADDLKRTTGIYDASLGNRSNETSGVAIRERQQEAQLGNSVYADNMVKAIHQAGRIIVDMIPRVYDTQRVIRILGEDDQEKMVGINEVQMSLEGPQRVNDLTLGRYDVRISVGPSHDTKREAASEGMMEFLRVYPQAAPIIADLVVKTQDWEQSDRVAERLRKVLPPGVLDVEEMPDDQRAQYEQQQQAAQAAQQQQQQIQQAFMQTDLQKQQAEAAEAAADAEKSGLEVLEKQLELAIASGQMDAAINEAVSRALSSVLSPQYGPPQL